MIPFDPNHDPPALIIPVKVSGVIHSRPRTNLVGLIDTGADITAIPTTVKNRYNLPEMGRIQLEGIEGRSSTVFTVSMR